MYTVCIHTYIFIYVCIYIYIYTYIYMCVFWMYLGLDGKLGAVVELLVGHSSQPPRVPRRLHFGCQLLACC